MDKANSCLAAISEKEPLDLDPAGIVKNTFYGLKKNHNIIRHAGLTFYALQQDAHGGNNEIHIYKKRE